MRLNERNELYAVLRLLVASRPPPPSAMNESESRGGTKRTEQAMTLTKRCPIQNAQLVRFVL